MFKQSRGNVLVGLLVIVGIVWGVSSLFSSSKEEYNPAPASVYSGYDSYGASYYEEEENYPVGFEGSDYMEACNSDTGNCYDLEIDSDGENIERINFPNGGWRDVYYSNCEDGYCVVEDEDGTEWELQY